jgi:hypothetical protein
MHYLQERARDSRRNRKPRGPQAGGNKQIILTAFRIHASAVHATRDKINSWARRECESRKTIGPCNHNQDYQVLASSADKKFRAGKDSGTLGMLGPRKPTLVSTASPCTAPLGRLSGSVAQRPGQSDSLAGRKAERDKQQMGFRRRAKQVSSASHSRTPGFPKLLRLRRVVCGKP